MGRSPRRCAPSPSDGMVTRDEMHRLAGVVEAGPVDDDDWVCCPVCEEVECDTGCPLEPLRTAP